jgi:hypothetical protein
MLHMLTEATASVAEAQTLRSEAQEAVFDASQPPVPDIYRQGAAIVNM